MMEQGREYLKDNHDRNGKLIGNKAHDSSVLLLKC